MQPFRRTQQPSVPIDPDELIFGFLPVVKRAARRLVSRHECPEELSELVSAGLEGLLIALRELPVSADSVHLPFLRGRVHSAMLRHLRLVDHLSRAQRRQLERFEVCRRDLEGKLGRLAEAEELARAFGISLVEVEQLRVLAAEKSAVQAIQGVENPLEEDHSSSGGRVSEILDVEEGDPLAQLLSAESSRLVEIALDRLPEKERLCVVWSFYDNLTLKQVGDRLGFTEARASQLRTAGLRKMRKALRKMQ